MSCLLVTQVGEIMDKHWTEEECLRLIEMYRSLDVLWDSKHAGHYKKNLKDDAWNEIGAAVGRTAEQVKNKMMSLLASYRREKSKTNKCSGPGKDLSEVYTSRWFAYEAMSFLEQRPSKRRVSTENLEGSYVDEEILYKEESDEGNPEEIRFEQTLHTPSFKRMKREERKPEDDSGVIEIPKAAKFNHSSPENDEVSAFFNYVTTKVRNYSLATWRGVEKDIFEVLVKADRGHYE